MDRNLVAARYFGDLLRHLPVGEERAYLLDHRIEGKRVQGISARLVSSVLGLKCLSLCGQGEYPRVSQEAKKDEQNLENSHLATLSFL
jgi:hypothetical protein